MNNNRRIRLKPLFRQKLSGMYNCSGNAKKWNISAVSAAENRWYNQVDTIFIPVE